MKTLFLTHLEGNVIILLVLFIYLFQVTGVVDALLIVEQSVTCDHYRPSGSDTVTVIHISSWFQKQENVRVLTGLLSAE